MILIYKNTNKHHKFTNHGCIRVKSRFHFQNNSYFWKCLDFTLVIMRNYMKYIKNMYVNIWTEDFRSVLRKMY